MSADQAVPTEPAGEFPVPEQEWRGVAAEDVAERDLTAASGAKLQARSRRLLGRLLQPHRGRLGWTLLLGVLGELSYLAGPLIIAYGLDSAVPALTAGDSRPLVGATVAYLLAGVLNALFRAMFVRSAALLSQAVLLDLRADVFAHGQRLSVSFHESYTSGRVISRMTSDLDTLADLADEGLDGLLTGLLSVVTISVTLLVLDLSLGAVALLAFIPILLVSRWFQARSRSVYRRTRSAIATLIVHFTETLNGLRAVVSFRREARGRAIFGELNQQNAGANVESMMLLATYIPSVRLAGNLSLVATMALGSYQVIDGRLEVGVLVAFLLYVRRMYDPLDQMAMFYNGYQSAVAALEKISGLLEERPAVPEPAHPERLDDPAGRVDFEDVAFSYTPGVPILSPFDLHIPAGQTVAVVGATGAGKSTLAKLMARFYDPSQGRVVLDGHDVADLHDADLRRAVTLVTQESFLFSGSVADNIALGRPDATRAQIEAAADEIGAGEFIRALPDGFDTDVRKRGGRLSAGQRQLVAFARAFLADPAVLILDEATASLDIPSEQAVQRALHNVLHGRTAMIIAHRLSTVQIADRVLVMKDGHIVQDGSPADLIAGDGAYADLHEAWRASLV